MALVLLQKGVRKGVMRRRRMTTLPVQVLSSPLALLAVVWRVAMAAVWRAARGTIQAAARITLTMRMRGRTGTNLAAITVSRYVSVFGFPAPVAAHALCVCGHGLACMVMSDLCVCVCVPGG